MKLRATFYFFAILVLVRCGNLVPGSFSTTASPSSRAVTLSWTDSSGAETYRVAYGTTSGNYLQFPSSDARSPYTVTGLDNGTTYYFKVTAVTKLGKITESAEVLSTPR